MSKPNPATADVGVAPWRVPGRIAYIVNHSYPYSSDGYAVRTHGVATGLLHHGHSVIVINRPGNPWDMDGLEDAAVPAHRDIDGVRYLYLREPSVRTRAPEAWRAAAAEALQAKLAVFKPSLVMAASNWENALPALDAARALGLPFFYEVRGFWEVTRASREPGWEQTPEYRSIVERETWVAQQADRVFTLNTPMRDELVRRGVPGERIELAPNGYGALPDPGRRPALTREALGIRGRSVVGYVGSFNAYEGLDDLIRACAQLAHFGLDLTLLLVGSSSRLHLDGDCPETQRYRQLASEFGFADRLVLPGRIAPEDLDQYYGLIDLIVIPRKPLPVTELVSPIKPLEAAAHGKALLVSDVAPLVELAEGLGAARFRKADVAHLAEQIRALLTDEARRRRMGEQARDWVATQGRFETTLEPITREFCRLAPFDPARRPTESIGARNVRRPSATHPLRVAAVMDEFTYHCYAPECDLLQLDPECCLQELGAFRPDLLFIESAWKGKDDKWQLKISNNSPEINACIQWCKRRGIPTLFWNKEDPVHFSTFLPLARGVDHIFTTDIDCIPKYKHAVGHDRVHLLPFAAQPRLHNPIERFERKDAFNFAGSYYLRYPERQRDFAALIDAVKRYRPVDIYDRNFDNPHPHYSFPDAYKPMILGRLPFSEIDRAYKGYRYGINMNTIKQSQTMYARRVFELLASNTIVVSNFSRGVRLLFGDLVIASDAASELGRALEPLCADERVYRQRRLMGLRAVMREHTYAQRLGYLLARLRGESWRPAQPEVAVLGVARTAQEQERLIEQYQRQHYSARRLHLLGGEPGASLPEAADIQLHPDTPTGRAALIEAIYRAPLVAVFVASDNYGPEYLTDLALATAYSQAPAFGKAAYYQSDGETCVLQNDGRQYHLVDTLPARAALARTAQLPAGYLEQCLRDPDNATLHQGDLLATDELHYCRDGAGLDAALRRAILEDPPLERPPVTLSGHLASLAESLRPDPGTAASDEGLPHLSAEQLHQWIAQPESAQLGHALDESGALCVRSSLPADTFAYLWISKTLTRDELNLKLNSQFRLAAEHDLPDLRTVFEFFDARGEKIAHAMNGAVGGKHALAIPSECTHVRFGLRVQGAGRLKVQRLVLGNHGERPAAVAGRSRYLVLTKQYPAYDDLYRYGFLHSRVRAYHRHGVPVDLFRITAQPGQTYREFEGIDVASGDAQLLDATLATGRYTHVLVHLLDAQMWQVLSRHLDRIRVTVWIHGAEIQVWQRRAFDLDRLPPEEVIRQKTFSDQRKQLWQSILKDPHPNLHLVLVSNYLRNQATADLGVRFPERQCSIIHNYIDDTIFPYHPKGPDDRLKILSIRPYAKHFYGNDLTVAAILELSRKPFFNALTFTLVGDGELWEETTAPLRGLPNVTLERRFLTHPEVAEYHRGHGILLVPTRMDSQGVSRDEAMSSGLVPVTSRVAAVPEFVDESCALLAEPEDSTGLAAAIERLYSDPDLFVRLSQAAAERVRRQSGVASTIEREIALILRESQR